MHPGSAASYQGKIETLIRVSKQLKASRVKAAKPRVAKGSTPQDDSREPAAPRRSTAIKRGSKPGTGRTRARPAKK